MRHSFKPWRTYFKPDFHPSQQDARLATDWLQRHDAAYAVVGRP